MRCGALGRAYIRSMYARRFGKASSRCTKLAMSSVYAATKSATVTFSPTSTGRVSRCFSMTAAMSRKSWRARGISAASRFSIGYWCVWRAIRLRTGSQVGGEEPLLRILLREVQHDRDRFAQHEVVIDEDGDLAGGIHGQELRPSMLALRDVHLDVLEIEVQLPQHPQGTDSARRSKTVELHWPIVAGLNVRFGSSLCENASS